MRCNPVNQIDPSGNTPFPPGEIGEKYMYSCRCGWIDWSHASPRRGFIRNIADARDTAQTNFAWVEIDRRINARVVMYAPAAQGDANFRAMSLGMFISTENLFEEYVQSNSFNLGKMQSSFSNEDLVSNLIGFHRGIETYRIRADDATMTGIDEHTMKKYMRLCGVVGYEYYDENNISYNIAEFKRIQFLIYSQLRPIFGLEKHRIWGTRPAGQRWNGSVQARGSCNDLRCRGSEELPSELTTSITPKSPLDGWAWDSAALPVKSYDISLSEFGPSFPIITNKTFYGSDLNDKPLNWGPTGQ